MRRFWVLLDRLLIALTAAAGLYFLKVGRSYLTFPSAHKSELMLAAAVLCLTATLKWALGATLLGSDDWFVLPCGGHVGARKIPHDHQEVRCSLGCAHDRAELGAAASASRAMKPQAHAWITVCQLLIALGLSSWMASLLGIGLAGQGVLVAVALGVVLAVKSRSAAAKWAAGMSVVALLVFVLRDAIDWDDWGEFAIVLVALPFAFLNQESEDD